jgi:flap endonuclease-1
MEYSKAIEGLGLTHDQFVDLCILLGCDYCDTIRGIGPKTALKLVREYGCIEKILDNIDRTKYGVPQSWVPDEVHGNIQDNTRVSNLDVVEDMEDSVKVHPIYVQARHLFNNHNVQSSVQLKWTDCQPEELKKFLVDKMGFNKERVMSSIEKLQKAFKATSKAQMRMDSFFRVKPDSGTKRKQKDKKKRKQE